MADILKVNSKTAIVTLETKDLVEHDLLRWLRTSSKGVNKQCTIRDTPFEKCAAKIYVNKYPSDMVKLASKIIVKDQDTVDIYLQIAGRVSDQYYNHLDENVAVFKKTEITKAN